MKNNIIKIFIVSVFFSLVVSGVTQCAVQKKRMKILMVVASFPKLHDVCILNQITGLIDRGHDVWIYALHKGDFINVQQDVVRYNLVKKTIFKLPDSLDNYDIVMFQLGHKLWNIRKTHNYKGKIVICLRGYDITGFLQENPHAYNEYFDIGDLFMPVCDFFKSILIEQGCEEDKIIVHHSAIDCSKFKFKKRQMPRHGNINIISAGRFVEKKGFVYSIRAMAKLVRYFPHIKYTIIGDGALKRKYKKLIKKLHLESIVTLEGWHPHDEYIDILNQAHIFVAPSIIAKNNDQEGIPNVLKEAMAMGILVIATDHAGNPELITNNVSGFLVPERESDYIAEVIKYLLNHPERWTVIQQAAALKIKEEFELERENDKLEAILQGVLKK